MDPNGDSLRAAHKRREHAWQRLREWKQRQPPRNQPLTEVFLWVDEALAIARRGEELPGESLAEKTLRVAHLKRALATITSQP